MRRFQFRMFLKIFQIISLALLSTASFSQAPAIEWQKCFGGTGADGAVSIAETNDLGFIISGNSNSNDGDVSGNHGGLDYWIVKIDSNQNIAWQKSLGGTGNEYCYWLEQTSDGGYIIAGSSDSNDGDLTVNHGDFDCWIVKLSSSGILQWQKSYGSSLSDGANYVKQTSDGGYIVAGYNSANDGDATGNHGNADCWILKLDPNGNLQWQKSLGGSGVDISYFAQQTTDGGYLVTAQTTSNDGDVVGNHGAQDFWFLKLNASGNILWQKTFGGTGSDFIDGIIQTNDGGYILIGDSNSNDGDVTGNHGNYDYWIVKLDSARTMEWQRSYGGSSTELPLSILQTSDSGYVVGGTTESNDGDVTGNHGLDDYWVFKINNQGILQWQKCLGGSNPDYGSCLIQTTDQGYVIAGYGNSNDGDITNNHGSTDYWIVKLASDTANGIPSLESEENVFIYPNPATSEIRISNSELTIEEVEVYSVIAEKCLSSAVPKSEEIHIDVSSLKSGIYFVRVRTKDGVSASKFVKE